MNNAQQEPQSSKKTVFSIIFGIVGFVAAFLLVKAIMSPSVEKQMQQVETEMNKMCPTMVDEYTRLDSVVVPKKTRNLQYYYTLIGIEKEDIDFSIIENAIIENVKTSPQMAVLKKYEVLFDYKYHNGNGEKVAEINVVPSQYKD